MRICFTSGRETAFCSPNDAIIVGDREVGTGNESIILGSDSPIPLLLLRGSDSPIGEGPHTGISGGIDDTPTHSKVLSTTYSRVSSTQSNRS